MSHSNDSKKSSGMADANDNKNDQPLVREVANNIDMHQVVCPTPRKERWVGCELLKLIKHVLLHWRIEAR
jgi:hypothetical protein